jgi:hypothetical protein
VAVATPRNGATNARCLSLWPSFPARTTRPSLVACWGAVRYTPWVGEGVFFKYLGGKFSVPASPGTLAAQAVGSVQLRVGPQCAHGRTLGPMSEFLLWGLIGGPPRLPEKVARIDGQQTPAPELAEQQRSWLVASPNSWGR